MATEQILAVPHSREAEEAACGAVLINAEIYYDLARFLQPTDFYIHRHKWIWQAYQRLTEKRVPIDLLTLSEELERTGQLGEVGGSAYLMALSNQVPSSQNAETYGRIVEAHAVRRRAIAAANDIAQAAYDEEKDIENLLAVTQASAASIYEIQDDRQVTIGQAASESYDALDAIARNGRPKSISTGFYDCDKLLHGLHDDEFMLVATRPGKGKTIFLSEVAKNASSRSKPLHVLLHSLEMNRVQLTNRMIASLEDLSANDIRDGLLKENEWPLYTHAIEVMQDWTLYIDDTPSITPDQLLLSARRMKNLGKLDLLILDYVQIMGVSQAYGYQKNRNREQEVSYSARMLKHIARELHIPVLAAAQVNRSVDARADRRIVLSDLRESGSLEQEADIVMFIQPGEDDDYSPIKDVTFECAKNRNGPIGEFKLRFVSKSTKFLNATAVDSKRDWWE